MNKHFFLNNINDWLKRKYSIYESSIELYKDKIFFLSKTKTDGKKIFGELSYDSNFLLKSPVENFQEVNFKDKNCFIGFFNANLENSKRIALFFKYLIPNRISKKVSVGFGDRIGIGTNSHANAARNYDIFPIFAQQSIREITKTSKTPEDVLHNAVIGIFQSGFNCSWGADADHIRDKEGLSIMLNNKYLPYTMFTIDTYDYVNSAVNYSNNEIKNDKDFKRRFASSKKYIGKKFNFSGYKFLYDENKLYQIIKKYYKSLNFLLDCYNLISTKISDFDFEPTFDEINIDTTPEEHFYLVSEMLNEGIKFTSLAIKFPGIFEKGIDYIGSVEEFTNTLKIHNEITKYFGNYKLSLHSADDKFKIFKPFREILGNNFHIKTSGTTWMESLRTIAICEPDLFNLILDITFEKAEENSRDYYISLDYNKIADLIKTKNKVDLIDIDETRQLLHVSYGTILDKYRSEMISTLLSNEEEYTRNVMSNYEKHLDAILNI